MPGRRSRDRIGRQVEDALARRAAAAASGELPDAPLPAAPRGSPDPALAPRPADVVYRPSAAQRPNASLLFTLVRLALWLWALVRFQLGTALDVVIRRDTPARRAVRLRRTFERLGPTFVKVGQQLSVRADLLPYELCQELAQMQDRVAPFATARARAIIEAAIGAPIARTFREFEPEPIGSASLACVYKARLHSGAWVAVKVRRPGVVAVLAADVRALGWLLRLAEVLTVFKPGFTRNLRSEIGSMLFEELDFAREARNAELFRAEAARHGQRVTAPRVHFELSSRDVLVADYVAGTFLNQILKALDRGDAEALAGFARDGIDLPEVARNLMMTAHWQSLDGLLFHADPHPANIVVQPGNTLVFIDFGSCGRLTGRYKRLWHRFYQAMARDDVQEMVACAVAVLEPLPNLDVDGFAREVELMYWDWVYAMNSDHAAWWEKATGLLWLRFADIARRYQAHINSEVIRIFRAAFIYDTLVFRLSRSLDMRDEYLRFRRQAGKRARKRIRRAVWKRLAGGLQDEDYVAISTLWGMGRQLASRVQNYLDTPSPNFAREIGKSAYAVSLVLRVAALATGAYAAGVAGVHGYEAAAATTVEASGLLGLVAAGGAVEVAASALVFFLLRKTTLKLQEYETR